MDHHDAQRFPVSAVAGRPQIRVLAEICVDDLAGALAADRAGADRVELCANLLEGGTTPSMGLINSVMRSVKRSGVQVIVRPRGGDFVYDDAEIDVMCDDLRAIANAATHATTHVGVVVGALTPTGEVDGSVTKRLIAAAAPLAVTFHKAFDQTADLLAAYEVLREAGVERVLTSGGPGTALEGIDLLAELVRRSGRLAPDVSESAETPPTQRGPAVLVGGSVRAANVRAILSATGAREVHARLQVPSDRADGTLRTDPASITSFISELDAVAADSTRTSIAGPAPAATRDRCVAIALDIGGTNLKGAVVDASGHSIASRSVRAGNTGGQSIERIVELLKELRDHAQLFGHTVVGVGVVTPGMVDARNGMVRYASSLDWTDVPLRAILSAELGVPVEIGHDVRSSGLAESLFGASADVHNSVLIAIGTGVAASILSDGHPVVGAITTAGELGHIPAIPDGEDCTCGQRGCLEVYLSGAGLARRYAAAGGEPGLDAAAISARLGSDAIADQVWAEGVHAFALGLTSVTLLIDPLVIVLTGGVSRAGDRLLGPLRAELQKSLAWRKAPEIRLSELGTAGALIGAAVLAFRAGGRGDVTGSWSVADVLAEPEPASAASAS
jgi:glucokinase